MGGLPIPGRTALRGQFTERIRTALRARLHAAGLLCPVQGRPAQRAAARRHPRGWSEPPFLPESGPVRASEARPVRACREDHRRPPGHGYESGEHGERAKWRSTASRSSWRKVGGARFRRPRVVGCGAPAPTWERRLRAREPSLILEVANHIDSVEPVRISSKSLRKPAGAAGSGTKPSARSCLSGAGIQASPGSRSRHGRARMRGGQAVLRRSGGFSGELFGSRPATSCVFGAHIRPR